MSGVVCFAGPGLIELYVEQRVTAPASRTSAAKGYSFYDLTRRFRATDAGLKLALSLLVYVAPLAVFWSAPGRALADTEPTAITATLTSYDVSSAKAVLVADARAITLNASTPRVQIQLTKARANDQLFVTVDKPVDPKSIVDIQAIKRPVDPTDVALAVIASTVALLVAAFAATWGRPLGLLIGVDGKLSNSQVQLALWFGVVACAYAAMMGLRAAYLGWGDFGGVNLTAHVLALTGLSGLTFGAAKAIGVQKSQALANGPPAPLAVSAQAKPQVAPASSGEPNLLDLFCNSFNQTDLGDFQMMLITAVAVAIFAVAAIRALCQLDVADQTTLPDIDTTLLSSFGLGQGAYLIKKAVLPPGQG